MIDDAFYDFIKIISNSIAKDSTFLYNDASICSIDNLLNYNSAKWLQERPKPLVKLLAHLCHIPLGGLQTENKSTFLLSKMIELIYSAHNSRLQLPISFTENLHVYSLTHSKQIAQYNGATGPSGSYRFLQSWIIKQAAKPVPYPKGLAKSVFENEQIIGKT